jgi:hemerythrin-like domain-containing protein
MTTQDDIKNMCDFIKELLLEKNRKYGDSALNPVRIFSDADTVEQIKVRLDDKLSRIKSGQKDDNEDVINDLIGYLVLLKIGLKAKVK